jgi:hypothetical protein
MNLFIYRPKPRWNGIKTKLNKILHEILLLVERWITINYPPSDNIFITDHEKSTMFYTIKCFAKWTIYFTHYKDGAKKTRRNIWQIIEILNFPSLCRHLLIFPAIKFHLESNGIFFGIKLEWKSVSSKLYPKCASHLPLYLKTQNCNNAAAV